MHLRDYIEREGYGAYARLAEASGVSYGTLYNIVRGAVRAPQVATAKAIEEATGGEVTAAELLGLRK